MIGILGGTFNPIHYGHIRAAEQVFSALPVQEVQLLPCAIPVHRGAPQVSAKQRLSMIELAIAGRKGLGINRLELDRGGPSYMIDTLRLIREQQPDQTVCLILGGDAFNAFESWKCAPEILDLVHLVVCQRPGIVSDPGIYVERRVNTVERLSQVQQGFILFMSIDECNCSSSEVRRRLALSMSASDCLPEAVSEYIINNHLYENQCE